MRVRTIIAAVGAGLLALSTSAAVSGGGRPLSTELTGAAEVPGPGDPDGSGHARITLNQGQGEVCWDLSWTDVNGTVTAAHIHVGAVDEAGGVVVAFFNGATLPGTGSHSGCADGFEKELIKDIRQNSANYYVNVHSDLLPPGAIRGQLG